jgi:uncharacterized protein YvpB
MKRRNYSIFSALAVFALAVFLFKDNSYKEKKAIETEEIPEIAFEKEFSDQKNKQAEEIAVQDDEITLKKEEKIPDKVFLQVPFLSQAPFQKWDALHEDACEEASLLMVKYFLDGEKVITKEEGEKEIQNLVAYENKNGYGLSVTLQELDKIAENYFSVKKGRVEKNIKIEDIKRELAKGKPVIVGAAGKILPNPNFRNGGPNYHMLVIIGYDEEFFITNDPGTRLGKDFKYKFDDLFEAAHDWNEKNILIGEKNYLVFD